MKKPNEIGKNAFEEIWRQISDLFENNLNGINYAYQRFKPDSSSINLKITFSDVGDAGVNIKTEMRYRPEPDVKDFVDGDINEIQMSIFSDGETKENEKKNE